MTNASGVCSRRTEKRTGASVGLLAGFSGFDDSAERLAAILLQLAALGLRDGVKETKGAGVRRNFSISCMIFAWLCANGALWNTVQVVGWAKMIHDYSGTMSMEKALEITFDGSAPCNFCHLSEKGENTARQQLPADAVLGGGMKKLLMATEELAPIVLVTPDFAWPGVVNDAGSIRTESVPVPPPRCLS